MSRTKGDITELSDREIDVFTEGEEHALRELAQAARDYPNDLVLGTFKELLRMAGYAYPNEQGEWEPTP